MQVSREDLHSEIASIHNLYKNHARFKSDYNLLQRKYKSCLLSLKTVRSENQALTENFTAQYISKEVYESVVKEREELRLQCVALKNDYNNSVNETQISYQSTCNALNKLKSEHKIVLQKCQELKSRNHSLENATLNVNQQLKEENEDLMRELEECKEICAKSLKENDQLRCTVKLHDDLKKKYAALLGSNHDFTRECDRMRGKIQSLDATVHQLQQSRLEDQQKLTNLTMENKNLLGVCASLRNECAQAKKQVEMKSLAQSDKCDVSSFELQKKYDKSVRNSESLLLDIRQLLAKYDKIKEDNEEYQITTESKFNYEFIQKDVCDMVNCDDSNAVSQSIPYIKKIVKQENRNSQVINNKYEIRKLISDSPTLEQSVHDDVLSDEDEDMLRFIFKSAKFSVSLLSPIPSPISHEKTGIEIADACNYSNEIDPNDVSIGKHQISTEEAPVILPGTSSLNDQMSTRTIDTVDVTEVDKVKERLTNTNVSHKTNDSRTNEEVTKQNKDVTAPINGKQEAAVVLHIPEDLSRVDDQVLKNYLIKSKSELIDFKLLNSKKADFPDCELGDLKEQSNSENEVVDTEDKSQNGVITEDELFVTNTCIKILPACGVKVKLKIDQTNKSKSISDSDNADSAFGSTCSSDDELAGSKTIASTILDFESKLKDVAELADSHKTSNSKNDVCSETKNNVNAESSAQDDMNNEFTLGFQDGHVVVASQRGSVKKVIGKTRHSPRRRPETTVIKKYVPRKRKSFVITLEESHQLQLSDSKKIRFSDSPSDSKNISVALSESFLESHKASAASPETSRDSENISEFNCAIYSDSFSMSHKESASPASPEPCRDSENISEINCVIDSSVTLSESFSGSDKESASPASPDPIQDNENVFESNCAVDSAVTLGESFSESASPASPEPYRGDEDFSPVIIPTHKAKGMSFVKGRQLLQDMLQYCHNNNVVFEVARKFVNESPAYIAKIILQQVSTDIHDTPTKGDYPMEPHLTVIQKGLYKFMMALEKLGVEGVCRSFFQEADLYLRSVDSPVLLEPVTRLYVAICKGKCDYWQMRMALCSALADMGDLAMPYMYIVLQTWIEVLPRNDAPSRSHVLPKSIIQLVLLKKLTTPGYNLINLRLLLFNYYKFSSDGDDSKRLFKELIECYIGEQNECARVLAIALSEYVDIRLVVKEIFTNLLPYVSPTVTVQRVNAVITLVIHFTKHLSDKVDGASLQANIEWLRQFSSASYPRAVQEHAKQMLNWLVRCDSVPYNILEGV